VTTASTDEVSPLDVEGLRARVQKRLDDFFAHQDGVLEAVSPDVAPMMEAVSTLLRGGKRLRPAFCYWGWRGAGGPDVAAIIDACAALELFQGAALIHDDVMDGSDTRRGMPSVHRRFAALHRGSSWLGSPESYGVAGAILCGDLCLCWSDEMIAGADIDRERLAKGRAVYHVMRTQLMGGQYLDMLEQTRANEPGGGTVDRALNVIRYKSAKYSVEHPLLLGGCLAGADDELLKAYSAYGMPLGEAFQLRDDVLGVFGDPAETGKPAGDDLREGKRTVMIAAALERATPAQAATVRRHLGDPRLDATGVDTLREIVVGTGALDEVERRITALTDEALGALRSSAVEEPARSVLTSLATAATQRRG
jgi:geranylgeranyl diphosphate synthase type I